MTYRSPLLPTILLLPTLLCATTAQARPKVVAYVPKWTDLKTFSDTIDYTKVTHLNLAFENPANDQGDLSFDAKDEFLIARARAARVKVLVSIGGGSASTDRTLKQRYFTLLTDAHRAEYVAKISTYLAKHQFDGLDVDIEGPSINKDYGAFIAELARVLKPKQQLLTAALSQGYGGNHVPDSVFEQFDFVNIMAYDGAGPWDPKSPGQHASMEFARSNVEYWLKRGLPKSKAVLGVPFYGYGFGKAFRKSDYAYNKIVTDFPGAENSDQAGDTIWYNGIPTIRAKSQYVLDSELAGVMIWSLDTDAPGPRSLLTVIHSTLNPEAKPGK